MKKLTLVCLAVAAIVSSDTSTNAAPVNLQLTLTTDSGAEIYISILDGAVTSLVPRELSGTMDISIDDSLSADFINDSTGIAFTGANLDIADTDFIISAGFLGHVDAGFMGLGINNLSSNGNMLLTTTNPINPFGYTFDPGSGSPTAIGIDQGLFTYYGNPASILVEPGVVDFGSAPLEGTLGLLGQVGQLTQHSILSDGLVYVTVSAPITYSDFLLTDIVQFEAEFSGALVATGVYPIPEPSSVVLLGIATVGLIPLWRRIRSN